MSTSLRRVPSTSDLPGAHPSLDALRHRLEGFEPRTLVELLLQLAAGDHELNERIETLTQAMSSRSRAKALLERGLEQLIDINDYHTRGEAREYVRAVEQWLDDVVFTILPTDPVTARDLLERLLRADRQIVESVDDSYGDVGQAFRRACELWHRAAGSDPAGEDWVNRVHSLHETNDYGLRDALLDYAGPHLPESELRRLAGIFEDRAGRSARKEERYERNSAIAAMGQVADTLRNASLYEKAIRIHPGEPNPSQAIEIARRYLEFGPVETAIEWLEKHRDERRFDHERLGLLAEAYQRMGLRDQLIAVRRELSGRSLSIEAFDELVAVLPEAEHVAARQAAIERARSSEDPVAAARLLLHLGDAAGSAELIIGRREVLKASFYGHLLELARELREAGESLAEVVCYRVLILQILDEGRSKAYHHAVDYVLQLDAIDRSFSSYAGLATHAAFTKELRAAHRRKSSFLRQLDER